jgi:hypothetical protein
MLVGINAGFWGEGTEFSPTGKGGRYLPLVRNWALNSSPGSVETT